MRLASFEADGGARSAVVDGDEIVDLASADPTISANLVEVLPLRLDDPERLARAVASGRGRRPLAGTTLAPPVRPRKFLCAGLNYADHVAEAGRPMPEHLSVFAKAVSSIAGPYDEIDLPRVSDQLDYEGELGFVIGRRCRHVTADEAPSVIAGYLIVNDVSVRDWQLRTPQWTLGKSFDTHGPIGPWIVTPDELGDPHRLGIRTYVNGELRQSSNTEHLIWNCFQQVELLSAACTLEPGDVIATGTPSGVAAAMPGTPWLVNGDAVRVEIDGIGAIEGRVRPEPR